MKYTALLFAFASFGICLNAQSEDRDEIIAPIKTLFDGMRTGDSTMVQGLFAPGATLSSIFRNRDGEVVKRSNPVGRWVTAVGTPRDQIWDEKIWSYEVKCDGPMAYVWTEYTFYVDSDLSHCGVNMFEMMETDGGWKITAITDTRRRAECITDPKLDIHKLVDEWHKAASRGDEDTYFGAMTPQAIFIGTDASERWLRDELKECSRPYFERDSAWSFAPIERTITLSDDGEFAWFDELLDTWMGTCRSTGVVVHTDEGWRIRYYHLSIAVPNEHVNGYLDLIGKSRG